MTFSEFQKLLPFSVEETCSEYFRGKNSNIKVKKEHVAVKNLVAIINATLKLSNQKGFQEMSLRDLCKESGLSMGALYSYIASKDELVSMIHDLGHGTVYRVINAQLKKDMAPLEKLRVAVRIHVYLSELIQQWFYFFFMETKNLKKSDHRRPIESELLTEKIIVDILQEGLGKKQFSVSNPVLAASIIKAILQDWYLKRWKYRDRKTTVEEYVDYTLEFIEAFIAYHK